MKKLSLLLTVLLLAGLLTACGEALPEPETDAIRVACVGDSLTYGMLVSGRKTYCYPARLQVLLGSGYDVRNFGVSGYTMQRSGDRPYWEHEYFTESTEFQPDIIVLLLGSNDTKEMNWVSAEAYKADYIDMLEHYLSLPSNPRVILMTPPVGFTKYGKKKLFYKIDSDRLAEASEVVRELAESYGLELIDLQDLTVGQKDLFTFDGVHTNRKGAQFFADHVHAKINES